MNELNEKIWSFVEEHLKEDVSSLALRKSRYPMLSDEEFAFALQQIEARQRLKDKLPTLVQQKEPYWFFPIKLSCEQASSEATALYKQSLLREMGADHLIDLTGGAGIDSYYLSQCVGSADYVEQNEELCRLAAHNLPHSVVHHDTAESYLEKTEAIPGRKICFYIDPARRSNTGNKVFRIEDCTPDLRCIMHQIRQKWNHESVLVMLKLSPLMDISAARETLGGQWNTYILSVHNEVKELLLVSTDDSEQITAVDLPEMQIFTFTQEEEAESETAYLTDIPSEGYILEPSAAVLKAGAFRTIAARNHLRKFDKDSHLYFSDTLPEHWQGRSFRIHGDMEMQKGMQVNVMARHYPQTADQLRSQLTKKWKIKDGGNTFVIASTISRHPTILFADRV